MTRNRAWVAGHPRGWRNLFLLTIGTLTLPAYGADGMKSNDSPIMAIPGGASVGRDGPTPAGR